MYSKSKGSGYDQTSDTNKGLTSQLTMLHENCSNLNQTKVLTKLSETLSTTCFSKFVTFQSTITDTQAGLQIQSNIESAGKHWTCIFSFIARLKAT